MASLSLLLHLSSLIGVVFARLALSGRDAPSPSPSEIDDPDGYDLVFGPIDRPNEAPAYMGFENISEYNIAICAKMCNTRDFDKEGGACQFFNIYEYKNDTQSVNNTICAMYYTPTNDTTAVNARGGTISNSRGYRRRPVLVDDGGFENYTCSDDDDFCYTPLTSSWKGLTSGSLTNAWILHYSPYAHTGNSAGLLGEINERSTALGNLTYMEPLLTAQGKQYAINFFYWSGFNEQNANNSAFVEVIWNGNVIEHIVSESNDWTFHNSIVTAAGSDTLGFGGGGAPAWIFIDDVQVFLQY